MRPFTISDIASVRWARKEHFPMVTLMMLMQGHTRDELVEAIDATRRHERNHDAADHENHVLSCQAAGIPLINGRPARDVATRYVAQF